MTGIKNMACANKSVAKEAAGKISCGRYKSLSFRLGMKTYNVLKYMCVATIVIVASCFMTGCQQDDSYSNSTPIENEIVNSVELEEYIIAASDFKQSLSLFEKEISKIDFSKLEITYDTDGKEIMRLSASIGSIRIEEKIQIFNETKQALLEKYPQFASFTLDRSKKYFQQCIQNSLNVSGKLLELGINFSRPLLKNGSTEFFPGSNYMGFLADQVASSNYVEVIVLIFANGQSMSYIDDNATSCSTSISLTKRNGYYYYSSYSSQVATIIHTHNNNGTASSIDIASKLPGITHKIYYNGSLYTY